MKVAIVGAGRQRPDRRLRPAPGSRDPAVRGRCGRRRSRQDGRRRRPSRAGRRRHRLHRLQRAHLPDASSACSPSSASRRSRATCPWARPVARATSSSARAGPAATSPRPGVHRPARALADDRRHPAVLPRCPAHPRPAGHVHARPWATSSTTAATGRASGATSWCRSRPPSGRPRADRILDFPIDYLLRFLDHHGLIGYGNALQWRTDPGRLDAVRRADRGSPARPAPSGPARPWSDVARDATGVTIRTADGAAERFDAVDHGHPRGPRARPAPRRRPAGADPRWAASSTRPTRSCSTPTSACCRVGLPPGRRGTSTRTTARVRVRP